MHRLIPLLLVLSACTATNTSSDFLPDTIKLQPQPDGTSTWISDSFVDYERYLIQPFVVCFHPNVRGVAIDPNELDYLLTYLRGAVIDKLDDDYLLAREPGPGVLRIEVALTNLYERPDSRLGLENAVAEMRGVDSGTGELVIAAVGARGLRDLDQGGAGGWKGGAAEARAQRCADWLKQQLDLAYEEESAGEG